MSVSGSSRLVDLSGLEGFTRIDGLELEDLPGLTSLQALAGLDYVLAVRLTRTGVTDLQGLHNVGSLATELFVSENSSLTSLRALTSLTGAAPSSCRTAASGV